MRSRGRGSVLRSVWRIVVCFGFVKRVSQRLCCNAVSDFNPRIKAGDQWQIGMEFDEEAQ